MPCQEIFSVWHKKIPATNDRDFYSSTLSVRRIRLIIYCIVFSFYCFDATTWSFQTTIKRCAAYGFYIHFFEWLLDNMHLSCHQLRPTSFAGKGFRSTTDHCDRCYTTSAPISHADKDPIIMLLCSFFATMLLELIVYLFLLVSSLESEFYQIYSLLRLRLCI